MPRKKSKAEETPAPEPEPATTHEEEDIFSRFDPTKVISPESMAHLIKAGVELLQAVDNIAPKDKVPAEVKLHVHNIKREVLLLSRAVIDYKLSEMDKKKGEPSGKLRKIELQ